MLTTSKTLLAAATLLAWAATAAEGLLLTSPNSASIWDITGVNPNYILWQLYPLTNPPPAPNFFDVYIRNGIGAMYNPPLNLTLATAIDSVSNSFYQVPNAALFIPGPGYQLFLSDPADAEIVYTQSEVFSIGSTEVGAVITTPLPSSTPSSPSSAADSTATTSVTTTTTARVQVTASSTSSVAGQISPATVPGGPAEQGFNLIKSGAGALSASVAVAMGVAGAAAALMAV